MPTDSFRSTSYTSQMRLATKDLDSQIKLGNVSKSQFTDAQLRAIESGKSKIPGYTWHQHQDTGRMQLVLTDTHKKTGHIGGEKMDKGQ
nr:HNH endonuclease [Moraxella osloensis]